MSSPAPPERRSVGRRRPARPGPAGRQPDVDPRWAAAAHAPIDGGAALLRWRNALVEANLPLARSLVARSPARQQIGFDDLLQVASLALIRAVEAFDPARGLSFSSFAVPSIRGALLHELRDRRPMVRIPRSLWELRQRARQLQEARRRLGEAPLDAASLADCLGCGAEQLLEIERLQEAAEPRSLDAPLGSDPDAATLLDVIPDPLSLQAGGGAEELSACSAAEASAGCGVWSAEEQSWLHRRLEALDPQHRQLVEGRLRLGMTWVELGRQLGLHPRMAQRRTLACLSALREEAERWRQARGRGGPAQPDPGLGEGKAG